MKKIMLCLSLLYLTSCATSTFKWIKNEDHGYYFCYDLKLPLAYIDANNDGAVDQIICSRKPGKPGPSIVYSDLNFDGILDEKISSDQNRKAITEKVNIPVPQSPNSWQKFMQKAMLNMAQQ